MIDALPSIARGAVSSPPDTEDRPPADRSTDPLVARCPDPLIRVTGLIGITVQRPDLDTVQRFFADFGLVPAAPPGPDVLHLRGAGPEPVLYTALRASTPRFIGLAFSADDAALEHLAAAEQASIEALDTPGGGRRVRLTDPQGWQVDVIAGRTDGIVAVPARPAGSQESRADGIAAAPERPAGAHRKYNAAMPSRASPRADLPSLTAPPDSGRINTPVRIAVQPPPIRKLGHIALEVVDFDVTTRWYIDRFGLIPSDVQVLDDGTPALVFLRCDRGAAPTDHHALVISRSIEARFNHAAFEVDDIDALAMGQRILRERGWRHAWGLGRHLMGSQIFDYWRDPWGDLVEHYADGDRFDVEQQAGMGPFGRDTLSQWGPPVPSDFIDQRMSPRRLWALMRTLRRSPELTLKRLLALRRALK